jgi:hypothetical protein
VNTIDPKFPAHGNNLIPVQVALAGRCGTKANCLIRKQDMGRLPVDFRIYRHGADAHFADRAHDPEGDFATVGDKNFFHLESFS